MTCPTVPVGTTHYGVLALRVNIPCLPFDELHYTLLSTPHY